MIPVDISPLQQVNFSVLQLQYKYIPDSVVEDALKVDELFQLPLEVDYKLKRLSSEEHLYRMFLKININNASGSIHNGYSIFLHTASTFVIHGYEELDEKTIDNLKGISMVSLSIAEARGFLKNQTAFSPKGSYTLPAVDIVKLIRDRRKQAKKKT